MRAAPVCVTRAGPAVRRGARGPARAAAEECEHSETGGGVRARARPCAAARRQGPGAHGAADADAQAVRGAWWMVWRSARFHRFGKAPASAGN